MRLYLCVPKAHWSQGQHFPKIMKPPQSLPLQMAELLLRAQPDSAANHVTARSISDWRAFTWLATETGWARSKRSAICSGKFIEATWFDTTWTGSMASRIYMYMSVTLIDAVALSDFVLRHRIYIILLTYLLTKFRSCDTIPLNSKRAFSSWCACNNKLVALIRTLRVNPILPRMCSSPHGMQ